VTDTGSRRPPRTSRANDRPSIQQQGGRRYYGKYRGIVIDNVDPQFQGRLLVEVSSVPSTQLNWAMPCVPYAGVECGFYFPPEIGANVWVEFEGGNPQMPIVGGCFWAIGEVPLGGVDPMIKVLRTLGTTMIFNDTPGVGGLTTLIAEPVVEDPITITANPGGLQMLVGPEAIFAMTPESISLSTEPTNLLVSPEVVEIEIAPSTITMSEEGMEITSDEVSITANVTVEGAVEIEGEVEITGAMEVIGDVEIVGGLEVQGEINLAGAVEIEGEVEIAAISLEVQAPLINLTGFVMVEGFVMVGGDLVIDGMQPSMVGMIV